MVDYINLWAKGIVIAVIVGTIIEMILPEGNNKKYIKTVIGIYILFVIIYPLINKITGKSININDIVKNTYEVAYKEENNKISIDTNKYIEDTYIQNLQNEIKDNLECKGYVIKNIKIEIERENENRYGEINSVTLIISKSNINIEKDIKNIEEDNSKKNIEIINNVEKIEINLNNNIQNANITSNEINTNSQQKEYLTIEEINEVKNYLSNTYLVSTDKIYIN